MGGEAVSLALARESSYSSTFPAAGYAAIISNDSYVGGHVRQYGNLSFSRVFDAGHMIPSYQAETSFVVFSRIIRGDDIGMGQSVDLSTFGTQGPGKSLHTNRVPVQARSTCWIRAIDDTCTEDEKHQIYKGLGVVENGKWFAHAPDRSPPSRPESLDIKAGDPVTENDVQEEWPTTTSSIPLTGVFTATTTPTPTSGASQVRLRIKFRHRRQLPQVVAANGLSKIGTIASSVKNGLIGGIAAVGGLLLL
jgi:hypothetical protein